MIFFEGNVKLARNSLQFFVLGLGLGFFFIVLCIMI